ncbi:MAG: LppC family lipoprotein [Piscirickettsiaceae bacterium]|nr:MAG: LppC family lipoprotein [Piscirickettsiaceae bacterium]
MKDNKQFYALLKKVVFIIIISLSLPHCTSVPSSQHTRPTSSNDLLEQARLAGSQEQHIKAAQLYQQLAKTSPQANAEQYLIAAADAYLFAGDVTRAENIIASLPEQLIMQSVAVQLLQSKILLQQGKTEQSGNILDAIDKTRLSSTQRIELHSQRSSAFFQSGNLFESARERALLDTLLVEPGKKLSNQNRLIETLLLLSSQALDVLKPAPSDPMTGWMELAIALKAQSHTNGDNSAIALWQQTHPAHGANQSFLPSFLRESQQTYKAFGKVAVFLPSNGPYANSAQSIRKGIISAAYSLAKKWQPDVTFYDTYESSIQALYQRAINDGAKSIIGPLDKKNVAELQLLSDHSIPIIALNKIDGQTPSQTTSLSLNPEEDTLQIASLAWSKGLQRALILTPQTTFGNRIAGHFANVWQQFGGVVSGVQTYTPKQADYSLVIKSLLNLDDSISRFKRLRNKLNLSLEFEERRRHDVDFIFVIATPRDGRLIKPQLRFHRATKLPVFSTSKIYAGSLNPVADNDLDGVFFCDLPSLIEPDKQNGIDTASLLSRWAALSGSSKRLFSLGIDAYQAIPHVERLKNSSFARFSGNTGILSINSSGIILRQLSCATFKRGHLKPLGLAPHLEKTDVFQTPETTPNGQTSSQAIPL